MVELAKYQVEFANSEAQFIKKTRATLQIQSAQLERLEVQVGQMTRILLEEQQRILPTLEEPIREEVDAMELHELVVSEEGSTSPKPNEIIKEVKILPEMIIWGEVHEKLENHKMTPILELDEIIFELNENLKVIMMKKAPKYLKKHASQNEYVLKQLQHNLSFLGEDGGKNHQPFRSW